MIQPATTISARATLRDATRGEHDAVDQLFSQLDLSRAADYGRFLRAQAAAFLPCEAALDRADAASVVADWPARRRSDALREDLAELSLSPPAPSTAPIVDTPARILGAIYVLEGSRLGGAMLARSVGADLPTRFLSAAPPGAWRGLIRLLDETLITEQQIGDATIAACDVFGMFERAARAELESD